MAEREEIETFEATEMSMLCSECNSYINLINLQEHRSLHSALSLYRYECLTLPQDEQALNRQRCALVKGLNNRLISNRPAYQRELAKIDQACEVIKKEINRGTGRFETIKHSNFSGNDVKIKSVMANLNNSISLAVCRTANERWRSVMEDEFQYCSDEIRGKQTAYFAVFDGYSGQTAAIKCACHLEKIVLDHLRKDNFHECAEGEICHLSGTFRLAFAEMDNILLLGDDERSRNRWSGCSATACLVIDRVLHVANVGNVKAIILQNGIPITLTEDHTPANKKEKHRIKVNGDIHRWSKTALVNGVAMTTRGLGNHGDPVLKSSLINVPAVYCYRLRKDDQVILIASNGLWEVFGEKEVVQIIKDWLCRKASEIPGVASSINCKDVDNYYLIGEEVFTVDVEEVSKDKIKCTDEENENSQSQKPIDEAFVLENDSNFVENPTRQKTVSERTFYELFKDVVNNFDDDVVVLELSKLIITAALTGGSKDNITVMVVFLKEN